MSLQVRLTPNPVFGKKPSASAPIRPCALKDMAETCVWGWAPEWQAVLLLPKPCAELLSSSCLCFPRLLLLLLQNQAIQLQRSLSCCLCLLHTNTATHLQPLGDMRLPPTEEFYQVFFCQWERVTSGEPRNPRISDIPSTEPAKGPEETMPVFNCLRFPTKDNLTKVGSWCTPGSYTPGISKPCIVGQSLDSQTRSNKFLFFSWKQRRWRRAGLCYLPALMLKVLKEHLCSLTLSMFPPKSFWGLISSLLSYR